MDDAIAAALALRGDTTVADRTIDITTTGAKSHQPRRIEIWFHNVDGTVYITGSPGRRAWYANLQAEPRLTLHLKNKVKADLPATASLITDEGERTRVFEGIVRGIDEMYARNGSDQRVQHADRWIADSPLVRVAFD